MASTTITSISNFFYLIFPSKSSPPPTPHTQFSPPLPPLSSSSPQYLSISSPSPRIGINESHEKNKNNNKKKSSDGYHGLNFQRLPSDLMSVVCPSLAYANTLYFSSAYNVEVLVDENEPEDLVLSRFRREVMRAGILQECKRRRRHENAQDERKRKARESAKRNAAARRRRSEGSSFDDYQGPGEAKKEEDDDDNWDMVETEIPY